MLTALWHLSAAIRGYLRFYMPTNRAVDWLRTPRGLKWAIPVSLVSTPAYLGLTALAIQCAAHPGLGFLNVLVLLFFWNAMKFAWMAVLSVPLMLGRTLRSSRDALRARSGSSRACARTESPPSHGPGRAVLPLSHSRPAGAGGRLRPS